MEEKGFWELRQPSGYHRRQSIGRLMKLLERPSRQGAVGCQGSRGQVWPFWNLDE